jgi:YebC/PmpR family DNA-binding regulatory protein
MAGHSKFKNIMHRKGAQDAKRAKIFTRLGKELSVAVKQGADPDGNARLRAAIAACRAANMPKDNIDKVLKKAETGDLSDYSEIRYEGFGPEGVSIIVEALTDNKNRTASEVRTVFNKFNGNLGEKGCVSYLFDKIGSIIYPSSSGEIDNFIEFSIENDTKDIIENNDFYEIITKLENFNEIAENFTEKFGHPESANIIWKAKDIIKVSENSILTTYKLIAGLDDCEDVQNVFYNFEFDEKDLALIEQ